MGHVKPVWPATPCTSAADVDKGGLLAVAGSTAAADVGTVETPALWTILMKDHG